MFTEILVALAVLLTVTFHAAGIYFGIQAVLISRTPQAASGGVWRWCSARTLRSHCFLSLANPGSQVTRLQGQRDMLNLTRGSGRRSELWRHFALLFSKSIPTRSDWESVCEGCHQPVETRAGF